MTGAGTVRVGHRGPVTIVSIDRPARRNAVDRATAERLADAFRAFDADDDAAVAILRGEGPSFCAGADLAAVSTGEGNRVAPDGDGPMGPTRLRLGRPVIAAVHDEEEAMRRELAHGQASLRAGTVAGATRFASGAGRHGSSGQVTEA